MQVDGFVVTMVVATVALLPVAFVAVRKARRDGREMQAQKRKIEAEQAAKYQKMISI